MNKLKLYNTLSKEIEEFVPITPGEVKLYCCGPTVYDFQHIGNFKTFVVENLLVRVLKELGYSTQYVMNITDVGHLVSDADTGVDKMLLAAEKQGKSSAEIADFYTTQFLEDWDALTLLRPDVLCKATEHIPEMIALTERIIENGYGYQAGGNVYFDVAKFSDYGSLANLDLESLKAGARVDQDSNKKNHFDFALWFTKSKFAGQELTWDSPWGNGYPGWHIECSAMALKYLGETFDIHCGGIDHIPVHHTNEIAQTEAATGKKAVNFWVHSEFILLNAAKMSKSSGSFIVLDDLIADGYKPAVFKFLCLSTHYRKQLNFSKSALDNAANCIKRLVREYQSLHEQSPEAQASQTPRSEGYQQEFLGAITNDLNTPQAISVLWKSLADAEVRPSEKLNLLKFYDRFLGLDLPGLCADTNCGEIPAAVSELLELRAQARADKQWQQADLLRDQLADHGYRVIDTGGQQTLEKAD